MITRRSAVAGAVVIAGALAVSAPTAPAATAPTCGQVDAKTKTIARGTPTLNEQNAVTDQTFKRDTGHKTIFLSFNLAGCELATDARPPAVEINPRKGTDELPTDAIKLKGATPDGTTLDVKLDVDSAKFDAGSYGGLIVLRAPYMTTSRTPVAVSRSDNRFYLPALLGVIAAIGGLALFNFARKIGGAKLKVGRLALLGVVAIGAVAGAVAVLVNYYNQDVWTMGDNWWSAIVTGFTGATTGVMAGLLGDIWTKSDKAGGHKPEGDERDERVEAEEPEPAAV
jgi:hypothetical protein